MRPLQERIIAELDVSPSIDAAEQVRLRTAFLKDYLRAAGGRGLVLGISGGQDSSLAGRLCQLAAEELRAEGSVVAEFVAVRLPYGVQADEVDALLALDFIRPDRSVTFNIKRPVDGFEAEYADAYQQPMLDFSKGNVKARVRRSPNTRLPASLSCSWWAPTTRPRRSPGSSPSSGTAAPM